MRRLLDSILLVSLTLGLFGYLSLVFMNFGYFPGLSWVDQAFGFAYLHSLNLLVGYSNWGFGLSACVYLSILLLSFLFLNRRRGLKLNLRDTLGLGSGSMLLTEVGITLTQPQFLNIHVINAQQGTILASFSNLDLIAASSTGLICAVAVSILMGKSKRYRNPGLELDATRANQSASNIPPHSG